MTDVEIRRCVVRVVRQDGWSWGADPRSLLDDVLAAIPGMIDGVLADAVPSAAEGEVREPVRIRIPVRAEELRSLAVPAGDGMPGRVARRLAAALSDALRQYLAAPATLALVEAAPSPAFSGTGGEHPPPAPSTPEQAGPAVLRVLLTWERAGRLAVFLERLPEPVLRAWHRALTDGWQAPPTLLATTRDIAEAVAEVPEPDGPAAPARWRARIAALVTASARSGTAPSQPAVRAAVDARFGPTPGGVAEPSTSAAGRSAGIPPAPVSPCTSRVTVDMLPGVAREGSALPFLVLAELSRIGWIDAFEAAVAAADLTGHWPALAAALAFKVLDEPGHGWRRTPHTLASAAMFAGVPAPFVEHALPPAAELLAPPLDAVLADNLVAGHRAGEPLLVVPAGGAVLLDGDGLFPIAWADRPDGLRGWIDACPGSPVPDDHPRLDRAARVLAALRARPASTVAPLPGLERSLTLAAGAALASIGHTMWGPREDTDPLLTLERLHTLHAVARPAGNVLRIVLPLGGRYFALRDHGLLGVVPDVPWLPGALEIVGG
ncbi:hypothetical protein ACIBQ1_03510 [Nonomuraea sp. NPDC050153]|uniref:hypothetical protein n=1 Tax=Nonomuraea sp. NPDC050153 TaxID=3364359 RepID=UPI0037B2DF91